MALSGNQHLVRLVTMAVRSRENTLPEWKIPRWFGLFLITKSRKLDNAQAGPEKIGFSHKMSAWKDTSGILKNRGNPAHILMKPHGFIRRL